jgi:adenine/guanine phosphoribosyltransferase-like PRPP-binding protein
MLDVLLISHVGKFCVGVEARGFMFGPAIALAIGAKFVPLRKPRKLPGTSMFSSELQLCFCCTFFYMLRKGVACFGPSTSMP